MSKSYNNTIGLFDSDEEIDKKVMSIVTDSSSDIPQNVYAIHKLIKSESELAPIYEANKGKYKVLKEALAKDLKDFIKPLRDKRKMISEDTEYVRQVLKEGGERANEIAKKKLKEIKEKIGVN